MSDVIPGRLVWRAVRYYQRGNDYRWVTCLQASRIVGRYDNGATKQLAQALALTVSQVENLAAAGACYRMFRRFGVDSEVRRRLTPGHFAAMLDLWKRHELPPSEVAAQLRTAAETGASIPTMCAHVNGDNGQAEPTLADRLLTLQDRVTALRDRPEAAPVDNELAQALAWVCRASVKAGHL